jgi:hypothetical protein
MLPVVLSVAGIGGLLWWALSGESHDPSKPVPESIVKSIAAAVKTGDPAVMRDVAATIRKQGFAAQATSLENAARELDATIRSVPEAKPGKALLPAHRGQKVNPAPRADSALARRTAGALAQLLSSLTPADARNSSAVSEAVREYEQQERERGFYRGNIDGLYGPKAALTLATDHGIVPPQPLYWPKKDTAGAKNVYRAQLARFADADPQRREEWQQAMHIE